MSRITRLLALLTALLGGMGSLVAQQPYQLDTLWLSSDSVVLHLEILNYTLQPSTNSPLYPTIQGAGRTQQKGLPDLPLLAFRIPAGEGEARIYPIDSVCSTVAQGTMAPSPGPRIYTERTEPVRANYPAKGYYPNAHLVESPSYRWRDTAFTSLRLAPFQYQFETSTLTLCRSYTFAVTYKPLPTPALRFRRSTRAIRTTSDVPVMLIIGAEGHNNTVAPYIKERSMLGIHAVWRGLPTPIDSLDVIQEIALARTQYDTRLQYVLLIGDYNELPALRRRGTKKNKPGPNGTHSDMMYGCKPFAELPIPDIYVGRLPSSDPQKLTTMLNRGIAYGKRGDSDWMRAAALGISSQEKDEWAYEGRSDYEHIQHILDALPKELEKKHVNEDKDKNAPTTITNEMNAGESVVFYLGHGRPSMWSSVNFTTEHIRKLTNKQWPFVISGACLNGQPTTNNDYMAHEWLAVNAPNAPESMSGAIGFTGASDEIYWTEPMLALEHSGKVISESPAASIGDIFFKGSRKMVEQYPKSGGATCATMWNLFGDPSLPLRLTKSNKVSLNAPATLVAKTQEITCTTTHASLVTIRVERQGHEDSFLRYPVTDGSHNLAIPNLIPGDKVILCASNQTGHAPAYQEVAFTAPNEATLALVGSAIENTANSRIVPFITRMEQYTIKAIIRNIGQNTWPAGTQWKVTPFPSAGIVASIEEQPSGSIDTNAEVCLPISIATNQELAGTSLELTLEATANGKSHTFPISIEVLPLQMISIALPEGTPACPNAYLWMNLNGKEFVLSKDKPIRIPINAGTQEIRTHNSPLFADTLLQVNITPETRSIVLPVRSQVETRHEILFTSSAGQPVPLVLFSIDGKQGFQSNLNGIYSMDGDNQSHTLEVTDPRFEKSSFTLSTPACTANRTTVSLLPSREDRGRGLFLFPNPSSGTMILSSQTEITNIEVYSISGVTLLSQKASGYAAILDISSLPIGHYLVRVQLKEGKPITSLIVKR